MMNRSTGGRYAARGFWPRSRGFAAALWSAVALAAIPFARPLPAQTTLRLNFLDKMTGEPISCRLEATKSPKRFPRDRGALVSGSTILCEESAELKPPLGDYEFTVSSGIEFADIEGGFTVDLGAQNQFDIVLPRLVDSNAESWFSGDLASPLPPPQLARWGRADALNFVLSREVPAGGAVAASPQKPSGPQLGTASPSVLRSIELRTVPSGLVVTLIPRRPDVQTPPDLTTAQLDRIDAWLPQVQKLSADDWVIELSDIWHRDLPIVLGSLPVQAIRLLPAALRPNESLPITDAFHNPDPVRFTGPRGLGRLNEYLYWQTLESGFRLTATAASDFAADGRTHVGYNRVYVWLPPGGQTGPEAFLSGLANGFTWVTNGPLLRVRINGQSPGAVVAATVGQPQPVDLQADLTVRDEVDYLDVVFNGRSVYQARLEDHARRGKFPEIAVSESGWLLLRVVTANRDSYRMASTSPTYYEFGGRGRVSRTAVQFFQDWLRLAKADIAADATLAEHYGPAIHTAERFWARRAIEANSP